MAATRAMFEIVFEPRSYALMLRMAHVLDAEDLDDVIDLVGRRVLTFRRALHWIRETGRPTQVEISQMGQLVILEVIALATRPTWSDEMRRHAIDGALRIAGYPPVEAGPS